MSGISVSLGMLLMKGIPEGFLVSWAIHLFTNTRIELKKYLFLTGFYILATYLIRFLPITLGINTVLSLFVLIFAFQLVYKVGLNKVIRAVIASIAILILISIAEVFNVLLLTAIYGRELAETLFRSENGWTQGFYTMPSTLFLALLMVALYFILKAIRKRKNVHGKMVEKPDQQDSPSIGL